MTHLDSLKKIQIILSQISAVHCFVVDFSGDIIVPANNKPTLEAALFSASQELSLLKRIYKKIALCAALDEKILFIRFPYSYVQAAVPIVLKEKFIGAIFIGHASDFDGPICYLGKQTEKEILILNNKITSTQFKNGEFLKTQQLKNLAELVFFMLQQMTDKYQTQELEKELDYLRLKLRIEQEKDHIASNQEGKKRLEQMHMQYNPAFVYNALNTISRLALIENAPKTQEVTITWYELHRYSSELIGEISSFRDEIENTKKYLNIQNIRFQNKFQYEIDYPEEVNKLKIPGTVIIHLVEFLVLNDLYPKPEGGKIVIKAFYKQDCCIIRLWDDGIGFTEQELFRIQKEKFLEKEYDLSLFYQMSQVLIYFYGEYYKAEIKSTKGKGTFIELKIPFMTRES